VTKADEPENAAEEGRSRYLYMADEAHSNADKALDGSVRPTWLDVGRT
jgi:hypothetical protein